MCADEWRYPQTFHNTNVVMWEHAHAVHAGIPHFRIVPYLRSHTPFSCAVRPSVTLLPSNTRASLKLTSPESSDSSPDGDKRRMREGREDGSIIHYMRPLLSLSHLSQRRKTLLRCSYWAQKVTKALLRRHVSTIGLSPQSSLPSSITDSQTHNLQQPHRGVNTKRGSRLWSLESNIV